MKKSLLLKISMIAFLASCVLADDYNPEKVGLSTKRLKNIDTLIYKHIDETKIAGAVVLGGS